MTFTLYLTRLFEDDLKQLREIQSLQSKLSKIFRYLQDDPHRHQGSLRTETLKRAHRSGHEILKSRIDQSYRIAWRYEGPGGILLLRIGEHDFINEYATFNDTEILKELALPDEARPTTIEPVSYTHLRAHET